MGSYKAAMPGWSLSVRRIKRDGKPSQDPSELPGSLTIEKIDPIEARKPAKFVSKSRLALDAALALLPKTKAETIRKEFGV